MDSRVRKALHVWHGLPVSGMSSSEHVRTGWSHRPLARRTNHRHRRGDRGHRLLPVRSRQGLLGRQGAEGRFRKED
eukprot:g72816.t1